jgi:uncharacterized protein
MRNLALKLLLLVALLPGALAGAQTPPEFKRLSAYVPMKDGVQLAITLHFPPGQPADKRFPVLLWYLPGHRENIDPETGRLTPVWSAEDLRFFTSRGYALAAAEMRGSGASYGTRVLDRGPQIGLDGRELVTWIASQPWSDGHVGMVGASYQGFSQYATAAERPPALRAIFPEIAGFDDYTSMFRPGGILLRALSEFATTSIVRDDLNHYEASGARPRLPAAPVVDEDGDGELADEIPIDANGNGSFLDDGEPRYRDGQTRQHVYFRATRDHVGNSNLGLDTLRAAPFRDSPVGGTRWNFRDIDPSDRPARIAAAGIAVYNRGGWFDYHARDTVMWHATLSGRRAPSFLMMAHTGHGGFPASASEELYRAGPYFRHFNDRESTSAMLNEEKLQFFDRYVRGIDNGFEKRPPVRLYVMGRGWRGEAAWPLARQRLTNYYFAADGALSTRRGSAGTARWRVDLEADARSAGASRWNFGVSQAREPLSLDADAQRRKAFTTPPLARDIEVTGHPLLTVQLSSTQANGDLFAYLEDVAPDGRALLVTEGMLRLNYAALKPGQDIVSVPRSVIAVKPQLPWHGYNKADYVPDALAAGKSRSYELDLQPTAWLFRAGHRIRLSIAGADTPTFELHPSLKAEDPPEWTLTMGGASRLTLPEIPDR